MAMPISIRCMVFNFSYDVQMSLDALIESLQEDREQLTAQGWTELAMELDEDGSPQLWGTRMETDEEAEERASRDAHYAQVRARYAELAMLAKNPNLVIIDEEEGN